MLLHALLLSALVPTRALSAREPSLGSKPAAVQDSPRESAFARESRVRELAAAAPGPDAATEAILAGGDAWPARAGLLDALARGVEARPEIDFTPWVPVLLRATQDPHPNVRAGAWRVLAQVPRIAGLPGSPAGAVTTWEERLERARALARAGTDSAALEALCADEDPRVAQVALAEWVQAPHRDEARVAGAWWRAFEPAFPRADAQAVELLLLLELAPRGATLAREAVARAEARASVDPQAWGTAHAFGLAALARQGERLSDAQLDSLAKHWDAASRWSSQARPLLARAARALGKPLGERLLERAGAEADPESAMHALAGAVEALEPSEMLRLAWPAAHARAELAEAVWDSLRGRADAWDTEAVQAWLVPPVEPEQRGRILLVVSETFQQNRDPGSERVLLGALADSDPSVAAQAFQSLASTPDPRPWMEALHAAWSRRPRPWRLQRLGDLSRELAWTPFRSDLLELASQSRAWSASVAELLSPFRADEPVLEALQEWLEQDLAHLRELSRDGPDAELADARSLTSALALVRAVHMVGGERAVPNLVEALEASRERSLELGKASIRFLGRSETGRAQLPVWLAPGVASRLRAEAALALAGHPGGEAAIGVLLSGYAGYDEDLRSRALRAFGAAEDPASAARLAEVALAPTSGAGETLTAVECLGLRSRRTPELVETLFGWLDRPALDPELWILVVGALGASGDPRVHQRLVARLASLEARDPEHPFAARAAEERALKRETLIAVLARSDHVGELDDRTAFAGPLASAEPEFRARAAGERRAEVEFTWRAELELIGAFARAGRLDRVLDSVAGWRGLDARFLLESAQRARAEAPLTKGARPSASERLALAAGIALGGEAAVEDSVRVRFEARRLALEGARARGDDEAFAARGAALVRDVRSGAVPAGLLARALGDFDPRRGSDGLAQLACDVHLAHARRFVQAGRASDAEAELRAARASAGASRAARAAVDAMERELKGTDR